MIKSAFELRDFSPKGKCVAAQVFGVRSSFGGNEALDKLASDLGIRGDASDNDPMKAAAEGVVRDLMETAEEFEPGKEAGFTQEEINALYKAGVAMGAKAFVTAMKKEGAKKKKTPLKAAARKAKIKAKPGAVGDIIRSPFRFKALGRTMGRGARAAGAVLKTPIVAVPLGLGALGLGALGLYDRTKPVDDY